MTAVKKLAETSGETLNWYVPFAYFATFQASLSPPVEKLERKKKNYTTTLVHKNGHRNSAF
jgi:hypothetical protein